MENLRESVRSPSSKMSPANRALSSSLPPSKEFVRASALVHKSFATLAASSVGTLSSSQKRVRPDFDVEGDGVTPLPLSKRPYTRPEGIPPASEPSKDFKVANEPAVATLNGDSAEEEELEDDKMERYADEVTGSNPKQEPDEQLDYECEGTPEPELVNLPTSIPQSLSPSPDPAHIDEILGMLCGTQTARQSTGSPSKPRALAASQRALAEELALHESDSEDEVISTRDIKPIILHSPAKPVPAPQLHDQEMSDGDGVREVSPTQRSDSGERTTLTPVPNPSIPATLPVNHQKSSNPRPSQKPLSSRKSTGGSLEPINEFRRSESFW